VTYHGGATNTLVVSAGPPQCPGNRWRHYGWLPKAEGWQGYRMPTVDNWKAGGQALMRPIAQSAYGGGTAVRTYAHTLTRTVQGVDRVGHVVRKDAEAGAEVERGQSIHLRGGTHTHARDATHTRLGFTHINGRRAGAVPCRGPNSGTGATARTGTHWNNTHPHLEQTWLGAAAARAGWAPGGNTMRLVTRRVQSMKNRLLGAGGDRERVCVGGKGVGNGGSD